jgi:histidyl-tRNA synthetase
VALGEVNANEFAIGSIGGGGRYDNSTELSGVANMPGAGISFGVDRIYDVLEGCNIFPPQISSGSMVLFFNLGPTESNRAFELLQNLREQDISGEIYHEPSKLDKQFKYAERKGIPIVIIIGSKELAEDTCTIKQLKSRHQTTIAQKELLNYLSNLITSF